MSFNGFALMPSIFDRSRADALRVDYYTTCQESMLLHIQRLIYHVDGYRDMSKAESVATLERQHFAYLGHVLLIHLNRISE